MSRITVTPPALNAPQLFRLVEIAHETANLRLRAAALDILARELAPPVIVAAPVVGASPTLGGFVPYPGPRIDEADGFQIVREGTRTERRVPRPGKTCGDCRFFRHVGASGLCTNHNGSPGTQIPADTPWCTVFEPVPAATP